MFLLGGLSGFQQGFASGQNMIFGAGTADPVEKTIACMQTMN